MFHDPLIRKETCSNGLSPEQREMCRVFLVRGFFIVRGVVDDNGLQIVQKASRKEGSRFICGKHDEIPKFQVKKNLTLTFETEPLIFQAFDLGA